MPRRSRQRGPCLDVGGGGPDWSDHCRRWADEEAGEWLRLLYVAVTRAKSQVVAWWAPTKNAAASPLHRMLMRDPDGPDAAAPAHADAGLEPVTRLVALVVAPTLAAADLQRALRERIDPAFMPRPLVFVDALPRNETGKLPRDVLAALVARHARTAAAPTPVCDPAGTPAVAPGFTIPADHPALPGHFPGHPVVPGVVLLDHAIHAIGTALGRPLQTWRLGSAKFLSPVAPGEPLDLAYDAAASGAIRFTLRAGAREVASGVLSAPPATPSSAQGGAQS